MVFIPPPNFNKVKFQRWHFEQHQHFCHLKNILKTTCANYTTSIYEYDMNMILIQGGSEGVPIRFLDISRFIQISEEIGWVEFA